MRGAERIVFFDNRCVEPNAAYTYDALYRLIKATGREHLGQNGRPTPPDWSNTFHTNPLHPRDGRAMGTYVEEYWYDAVGNFLEMKHRNSDPELDWSRFYTYNEDSQLEPEKKSNRLSSTTINGTEESYSTEGDGYDDHGNMLHMPHLRVMAWDFKDQLQMVDMMGGGKAFYVYDAAGQRVRKVIENQDGVRQKERFYLSGFEIYRKFNGSDLLERETLHMMDDNQRRALVETRTQGIDSSPEQLIRYQFGNHLGSASLELDAAGQIISYEEYFPYGSTSYQAVPNGTETSKRYRYTGKERDDETGLYYYGARLFSPCLARWTSPDPIKKQGISCYVYVNNNPLNLIDPFGMQEIELPEFKWKKQERPLQKKEVKLKEFKWKKQEQSPSPQEFVVVKPPPEELRYLGESYTDYVNRMKKKGCFFLVLKKSMIFMLCKRQKSVLKVDILRVY